MNVSDYIVDFLFEKGVRDVFGYQGTMISYFVDSLYKTEKLKNHSCYNEQGAAFAACGFAQASGNCGVAYSTSGPGAANLLSGVANAYFDSLPVLFITGQVNTYEYTGIKEIRQQSFQEIDIVSMAKPVSKYAIKITDASDIRLELEKAWHIVNSGRKGSVLLDIPMNIQRTEIDPAELEGFEPENEAYDDPEEAIGVLQKMLDASKRPVFVIGNGVSREDQRLVAEFAEERSIPIVTSLLARSIAPSDHPCNFGYIGTYGTREANMICSGKADLLIAIGISLCTRQTGMKPEHFAPGAKLFRVDVDEYNLKRKIKPDERAFRLDGAEIISRLGQLKTKDCSPWLAVAAECKRVLNAFDDTLSERRPNSYIREISRLTEKAEAIACDVGQHMMWTGQSFSLRKGQTILFSGGHGAMGYALPAAIGAYYATKKPVVCIAGDGSFQMNIQELQWVARERLPIKMFVMNNRILGMIHFQQKEYFDSRFAGCSEEFDYLPCDFKEVAEAFRIPAARISSVDELASFGEHFGDDGPFLVELMIGGNTAAVPKTYLGEEIYNQKPYIEKEELEYLLKL